MYVHVKRCESNWTSLRNPKKAAHLEGGDTKRCSEPQQEGVNGEWRPGHSVWAKGYAQDRHLRSREHPPTPTPIHPHHQEESKHESL